MIRRFNFTERKRIEQERVNIEMIEAQDGGTASFNATVNLDGMELPPSAPVTIEAYRGRAAIRFAWGTVSVPQPPLDRLLVNMPDNPTFRVKVVAPDGSGVLLAMADRIRLQREERYGSLIRLEERDLGKEVWRLDCGEGDGNLTLLVNQNIPGIGAAAQHDGAFRGLVMPEVLRAALLHVLIVEDADWYAEEGEWADLLGFVRSFYDEPPAPATLDVAVDRRNKAEWADAAVAAFTQKHFRASDAYGTALGRR